MSKRIKILTPRIYEHSDFFHNAYDFARKKSLNTNELCLELSRYLVEHFNNVWKIEKPRIYKQICDLQSQLQQANEIINNPDTLIFQQQQLIGNLQSQLTITEKALELACEEHKKDSTPAKWIYHVSKEEYIEHIKTKAKEMMKSE